MLHRETWFYGTYPLTLHAIKPLNRRKLTLLAASRLSVSFRLTFLKIIDYLLTKYYY